MTAAESAVAGRPPGTVAVALMTAGLALLLALTWIFSGLAVEQAEPATVAAGRSFFSCVGILFLAGRSRGAMRRSWDLVRTRTPSLLLSGALGVAVYALASLSAIALLGISVPNLLLTSTPLLTLGLGALFFRARPVLAAVLGALLATLGAAGYVLLSLQANDDVPETQLLTGVLLALGAAAAMAVYGLHYARLSQGHDPVDLLPGIFGYGTVLLLAVLAMTGQLGELGRLAPESWLLLVLLGVVIYVPVYVLQHRLIHARGAMYTATISLLVPFVVRFLQVLLLGGAWPSLPEWLTMILCVAGVLLVIRHPARSAVRTGA
ncbi:EamA family transporter [Arthrobacter sp. NPDC090010]|uniref:EamA family transporter n=1 Tax=Arthrobacter sp. NPDC090010 TaxID=3363942 RepID=UPI00382E697B